jgi:hypothetical protein
MPGPIYLTVASGMTVSSCFALDKPVGLIVVEVSSFGSASGVFVDFTQTSGGGQMLPLQRADGSGLPFTVLSGTGGGTATLVPPCRSGECASGLLRVSPCQ